MRAIDRVDAIDATLVSAPTGHAVSEAGVARDKRVYVSDSRRGRGQALTHRRNISSCLDELGRHEEALEMLRGVYNEQKEADGIDDIETLSSALSMAMILSNLDRYADMKSCLDEHVLVAQRTLGPDHRFTLELRREQALATFKASSKRGIIGEHALVETCKITEDTHLRTRRVFGDQHHFTVRIRQFRDKMARIDLRYVRAETAGFAKFLLDHDVKMGIRKAAKTFKAMGASDAEIKAVLPAFGRHGVDVAKTWK